MERRVVVPSSPAGRQSTVESESTIVWYEAGVLVVAK